MYYVIKYLTCSLWSGKRGWWCIDNEDELFAASSSSSEPECGDWKTLSWDTLRAGWIELLLLWRRKEKKYIYVFYWIDLDPIKTIKLYNGKTSEHI